MRETARLAWCAVAAACVIGAVAPEATSAAKHKSRSRPLTCSRLRREERHPAELPLVLEAERARAPALEPEDGARRRVGRPRGGVRPELSGHHEVEGERAPVLEADEDELRPPLDRLQAPLAAVQEPDLRESMTCFVYKTVDRQ